MKRAIYMILIIVVSLITLTMYTTYAMFTTSVSSDTVLNLDTTLSYEFDINSSKKFTIDSNTVLHFNAIIKNNMTGNVKYGIYHDFNLSGNSNVSIGEIVTDATTTTTSLNGEGVLPKGSKTVPIAIINNSDTSITVSIGITTGYENNTLTYPTNTYKLTNTIDDDSIGDASCVSNITYDEENCYYEIVNGIKYKKCTVIVGEEEVPNLDKSGANPPVLAEGMIPVYWNGTSWAKADSNNADETYKWYDYDSKMWANAVLVKSGTRSTYMSSASGTVVSEGDILAYYVWIPRYKYTLFNTTSTSMSAQLINVTFQTSSQAKATGTTNGQELTHPAFTFGTDELDGFWVGKFETSVDTSDSCYSKFGLYSGDNTCNKVFNNPRIKAGVYPLIYQTTSNQFLTAQKFGTTNYLTSNGINQIDAHMMKNTEWGAVAYLKQSKYGLGTTDMGNNGYYYSGYNSDDIEYKVSKTGCGPLSESNLTGKTTSCKSYTSTIGVKASTTGTVYGVYDMAGGTSEYVMGVMKTSDGTGLVYQDSGFNTSTLPFGSKYVDAYAYGTTYNDQDAYNRRILGDATGEVRGWYSDSASKFANSSSGYYVGGSWFGRGGSYDDEASAGIFNFSSQQGENNTTVWKFTFRSVLTNK